MNWMQWIILLLVVVSFGVGIYYYDMLPDPMASHWDGEGNVNGYMEKTLAVFLIPVILAVFVGIFYVIPHIDPLKANIRKFDKYYQGFIVLFVFFLTYTQVLSVAWNLGYVFDMGKMIAPAMGIVFIYLGILMGNSKQNWFIGVRTPWTLSSQRVWERTHNIAKNIFMGIGLIWIAVGILAPAYTLYVLGLLLIAVIWLFVDSYLEYQKELKCGAPIKTGASMGAVSAAPMKTKAAAKKAKTPKKKPVKKAAAKPKKAAKKAPKKPVKKATKKK